MAEYMSIEHEHRGIILYSLQKLAHARRTLRNFFGPSAVDYGEELPEMTMPFSDNFVADLQIQQNEARQHFDDKFMESFGCTIAQIDHSCKRLKAMMIGGVKVAKNVLTIMNEWGGIVFMIATSTTAFSDHAAVAALASLRDLAKDVRARVSKVWLDAVIRDGPIVRELLELRGTKDMPKFDESSFEIVHVNSEARQRRRRSCALGRCD